MTPKLRSSFTALLVGAFILFVQVAPVAAGGRIP
jgi:hypothetical protein